MPEIEVNSAPVVSGDEEQEDSSPTPKEMPEEWMDVLGSGDIKVKTLVESESGIRPQSGDICILKIKAELEDGTVVENHEELSVELNSSEVVQGLDLVLSLVNCGSTVTAVVKARFAYGKQGLPPSVPPDATIIYTIELLRIDDAAELANVPFDGRKKKSIFKKDKGNWWYSRGDAQKAVQCYRAALDALQESTPYTDENEKVTEMPEEVFRDFVKQKMVIYNNLAAAQMVMDAYDSALDSVNRVTQIEPNNVKALYRKGKILVALGKTEEAVETFKHASNLEPENSAVRKELAACVKRQALEKEQAKSLYKRMLLGPKKEEEVVNTPKPKPSGGGGFSAKTKILGGAAVATVVGALAYAIQFKKLWE